MKTSSKLHQRRSAGSLPILLMMSFLLLPGVSCGGSDPEVQELPLTDQIEADAVTRDTTADLGPDSLIDTGRDLIAADTGRDLLAIDVQPDGIEPGQFGAPCDDYDDCESKLCVETEGGSVCTKLCLQDGCPEGYICSGIVNTYPDTIFLCMPIFSKVCTACTVDNQCAGGKCVEFPEGNFCTVPCDDADCPSGYNCETIGDGTEPYCVPPSGSCLCREKDAGTRRACQTTNEIGTCYGYESCDPEVGFTACDAPMATEEECNGLDDDCDGSPDDNIGDGDPCTVENEHGECPGTNVCMGIKGWACSAATPAPETCNGIDDDCDGFTDEDFKIDDVYGTIENCGACNKSCVGIFPNATVECDVSGTVPRCVVVDCDDGFFKLNDYQCIPLTSTICNTCVLDTDCIIEGARCVEFADGGRYCGQPCDDTGDCPTGYSCLPVEGGSDQCLPDSGSCTCDTPDPNITRVCQVSWQENPESPLYTCTGIQRCGEDGWTDCELPEEQCNGLDDNCNGDIDEGFLDPVSGKYITNENCGVCANNCTTMTVPNGFGVCDTDRTIPDCVVECSDDWFNVDGNPANGCECQYLSADDPPGGGDADCDGIDGKTDGAIFVAKWGDDLNPGSIDSPLRSIARAFTVAEGTGKDVYVATGIYTEPVSLRAGISIYGGFSADFRILNPVAYETVILGQEPEPLLPGAVNAVGITTGGPGSTVFSGFVVIAYNNRTSGENSIGLYVRNCNDALTVEKCRFVGGLAGNGAPGTPGISGEDGTNGSPGIAALDLPSLNCGSNTNPGGTGGNYTCGDTDVSGGNGGTAICPDSDEGNTGCDDDEKNQTRTVQENGQDGYNGGGAGGLAGLDGSISLSCQSTCTCRLPDASMTGQAGMIGPEGANGSAGTGCADSTGNVLDGVWTPSASLDGGTGSNGGGGGGGGAGGGVQTDSLAEQFCVNGDDESVGFSDLGGSGGGGGSGGCGASGGSSGGSGGGSFAVFVTYDSAPASVPSFGNLTIEPGQGGLGGNGGQGGVGGRGGDGALGGADGAGDISTFCAPAGGAGGNGGSGGHGGGGGGGCGGPAYGIFVHGVDAGIVSGWKSSVTFTGTGEGGAGGTGGTSFGQDGTDGANGVAANTNF